MANHRVCSVFRDCHLSTVSWLLTRRPVAQLAERRSPKPQVGGSIPSWPATRSRRWQNGSRADGRQDRSTRSEDRAGSRRCVVRGVWGYYYFARHRARAARADGARRPARRRRRRVARRRRARSSSRSRRKSWAEAGAVVVADAQGNGADDADRVRVRRGHGAFPVRGRFDARVAGASC